MFIALECCRPCPRPVSARNRSFTSGSKNGPSKAAASAYPLDCQTAQFGDQKASGFRINADLGITGGMVLGEDKLSIECQEFVDAWLGWRGSALVPRRETVRIEDIRTLLPFVSLIEVVSPEIARFRLAGTALYETLGIELTGHNFIDLTTLDGRARRIERTRNMVEHPCGAYAVYPMIHSTGRVVPTEVLSLPVSPNNPSAPPQLFAVSIALTNVEASKTVGSRGDLPRSEVFEYVDIGAGIPISGDANHAAASDSVAGQAI